MQTFHGVSSSSALSLVCRHRVALALCSPEWNDTRLIKQVGRLIRHLRHAAGWSQEGFAARCGLHRTYIGAIERGEKAITITTANKLAHALGMTLAVAERSSYVAFPMPPVCAEPCVAVPPDRVC